MVGDSWALIGNLPPCNLWGFTYNSVLKKSTESAVFRDGGERTRLASIALNLNWDVISGKMISNGFFRWNRARAEDCADRRSTRSSTTHSQFSIAHWGGSHIPRTDSSLQMPRHVRETISKHYTAFRGKFRKSGVDPFYFQTKSSDPSLVAGQSFGLSGS
jgi:hypothetical protein